MLRFEQLRFDNIYATLPPIFFCRHSAVALENQYLIHFNPQVARLLEINPEETHRPDLVELFARPGQFIGSDPLAMCYAGHQFGGYSPRLGDGRALLLGQIVTSTNKRWDLQLKGSGKTLYSRQGDGKAVLRSSIRAHLGSLAMHGLGIPTTHSLALFGSNEQVYRESVETGAMLIRVAPSHIRFGSFEYYFYSGRYDDLKTLADFTINHYFPHLGDCEDKYLGLLNAAIDSTANLIAQWQSVGFCHGVMNSDNMSIHGITIDYGPFGFLDTFEPAHICNHSDYSGRYAFNQQPNIGLFNLSCLAQAILPLLHPTPEQAAEIATAALRRYQPVYAQAELALQRRKLGLVEQHQHDRGLYAQLLQLMQIDQVDFTLLFRSLSEQGVQSCRDYFLDRGKFDSWSQRYCQRLSKEHLAAPDRQLQMQRHNPKYVLRNYMADQAIRQARDYNDFSEIAKLARLLQQPYVTQAGNAQYAMQPPDWSRRLAVSCSS